MKVVKPRKIKRGATIGVFTPSEPLNESRLGRLQSNIEYLKSLDYKVVCSPNFHSNEYYFAGSIDQRVSDINFLLNHKDVNVLMASWGGKSSSQLIQHLNYKLIRKKRKIFTAFSDGTLLLNAILRQTGLISVVGPNVVGKLDESEWSDLSFLQKSTKGEVLIKEAKPIQTGYGKGRLIGGNLSTFLLGLTGTDYIPESKGNIFIWEAGSATPQILDQYLTLLDNTGFLKGLSGMVIGTLENCQDSKDWGGRNPFELIKSITSEYNYPIIQTELFGHGNRVNPIIPLGVKAEIDAHKGSLTLLENSFE